MKKKKIFLVDWVIFPFNVMVCLGSTRKEIIKELKKFDYTLNEEESERLQMYGKGRTVMLDGGGTVLWLNYIPKKGSGVLAHEVFHVVQFLLVKIKMDIDRNNEELPAYMIEYLTNEISKRS